MIFSSLPSFRATSVKHDHRALTLVFGSDGQVSLIGFDGGITSQPPYTLTASNPGTASLPSVSSAVSTIPNLEATSASLIGTLSSTFAPTPTPTPTPPSSLTSFSSTLASSSHEPSTTTDTDTNLPSIPTISYPTPSPTAAPNPKDHGVGAPFYLAIVLASISFIGCLAALIAWWIRSRTRRRALDFDDPWEHGDTTSDSGGGPSTDKENGLEKGARGTKTRPYYLPASIVRRSSSNLLAVPHTIPALRDGTAQNSTSQAHVPNSYQNGPLSQTTRRYSRPGTERLQTGLSVQESTRTLGRLRVANRVPGDVTSGDEGATNVPRLQNNVRLSPSTNIGVVSAGENPMSNTRPGQNDFAVQEGDGPLEPPGPATLSWGRRTDTVAALRRTRRRTPGMIPQTYKNARYSGYLYPTRDEEPSGTTSETPATANREENDKSRANPPSEPLNWKSTLKSSFWQAVDAMTGSRPSDLESDPANTGSGSGFTPKPQRVASRRSPVSPTGLDTSSTLPGNHDVRSEGAGTKYEPTSSGESIATQDLPLTTRRDDSGLPRISEVTAGSVSSPPPRVSRLNRDLNASTRRSHPDSLRAETGSVYSTDSAAARANLRKYGYGDPIPSSWSALGAARESQLNLVSRPLPRTIPTPPSIAPSQLTLHSSLSSSSTSTRTRTRTGTPMHSESDLVGSDAGTLRSCKNANTTTAMTTTTTTTSSSTYSVSRSGTMLSVQSTAGHGALPLHSSSTTSSMLSRKKGVSSRRRRPVPLQRAPSTASSMQSIESGLSIKEMAVKRALLERRKRVKAASGGRVREDGLAQDRDASSFLAEDTST